MFILGEDVGWMLLPVTGVAIIILAVYKLVAEYGMTLPRPKELRANQKLLDPSGGLDVKEDNEWPGSSAWESMGKILPLHDFDYRAIEPLRIYKFSPKYFLTMGLQKTDINGIIHIDSLYAERIKARQDIVRQYPGALDCLDSGLRMLNELYEFLIQGYLPHRYPTIFRLDSSAGAVKNLVTNENLPLTAPADRYEALRIINRNVDEDFLMLLPSPDGDGYSLQSFVWAYPVGFDPQSKLGLKLRDAHKPVPSYTEKLAPSMDRYFSRLQPGNIKCRVNWALATSDILCERGEYHIYSDQEPTETDFDLENCYVRCELQTLFALPKSGGRVLSVHLYLYPLQEIKDVGLGPEMAEAIDGFQTGNAPGFHRYKR
ncbi:MAG: hypothetical protein LQ338_007502, partial [Usnochroma carphineum]